MRKKIYDKTSDQLNYIVLVDFSDVKSITIKKIDEWLEVLGKALLEIA